MIEEIDRLQRGISKLDADVSERTEQQLLGNAQLSKVAHRSAFDAFKDEAAAVQADAQTSDRAADGIRSPK